MTSVPPLRIATRASQLALWQARHIADLLRSADAGRSVELVEVSTHGDRVRSEPLAEMGGVGVFTREVQRAVLDGRADIAVHSLKDLPTQTAAGLALAGVPGRAARFDVLVLSDSADEDITTLEQLPAGARIGTGSPRRQAQLLHRRPDLLMADIRGNVETRLRKLDEGEYDAIVLAQAGLMRLGLTANHRLILLEPPIMYPAVGQAALGVECRADDEPTISLLRDLSDPTTRAEVTAERSCLRELQAGCHAPVGTLATVEDQRLTLHTVVLSADGTQRIEAEQTGDVGDAGQIGRELAQQLLADGAGPLIEPTPS
jgi:hydroxymethylbilane synthase